MRQVYPDYMKKAPHGPNKRTQAKEIKF